MVGSRWNNEMVCKKHLLSLCMLDAVHCAGCAGEPFWERHLLLSGNTLRGIDHSFFSRSPHADWQRLFDGGGSSNHCFFGRSPHDWRLVRAHASLYHRVAHGASNVLHSSIGPGAGGGRCQLWLSSDPCIVNAEGVVASGGNERWRWWRRGRTFLECRFLLRRPEVPFELYDLPSDSKAC